MVFQSRPWNAQPQEDRGDLGGYALVFEDDFDSLSVGSYSNKGAATWGNSPPYGASANFSFSHWMSSYPAKIPEVANVSGSVLSLWTKWYPEISDPGGRNWVSGCLASKDILENGFAQRFGYWSAKIKMPDAGVGSWPAFWLHSTAAIPSGVFTGYEVDTVEYYGGSTLNEWYDSLIHAWNSGGGQDATCSGGEGHVDVSDPIANWHVYGVEVNPTNIIGYLDGTIIYTKATCSGYIVDPLYIILNYGMKDVHTGEPFASFGPSVMEVDWVRAYELP